MVVTGDYLIRELKVLGIGDCCELFERAKIYTVAQLKKMEEYEFERAIQVVIDEMRSEEPGISNQAWRNRATRVQRIAMNLRTATPVSEAPSHFLCQIQWLEMFHPVISPTDFSTYERTAIEEWIEEHGTCPMTRKPLSKDMLIPNNRLKEAITYYNTYHRKFKITRKQPHEF